MIGLQYAATDIPAAEVELVKSVLAGLFEMHPVTFLPLVVILFMSFRGIAAEPAMITASIVAIAIAWFLQHRGIEQILHSVQHGYFVKSDLDSVDTLLNRGGIQSMMWTLSLSLIALALGGLLDGTGFLRVLTQNLVRRLKRTVQLVAATIATGFVANMSMGENYLTIIFSSQVFKGAFRKIGLKNRMLSRSVEEGATLTAGLIPWTTTGAFFAGSLGVATTAYAPWVLLSFTNIVVSITMASVGYGVFRTVRTAGEA
jgi:NhaC family Na+:H+ antiporter